MDEMMMMAIRSVLAGVAIGIAIGVLLAWATDTKGETP